MARAQQSVPAGAPQSAPSQARPSAPPAPQQMIVAEPNVQIFTVLAAINAAGYDEAANRPELAPMRAAVRKELATRDIPAVPALREYYQRHRLSEPGKDLSQYVSLALFLGPPPKFELELTARTLPPEIADLEDMVPLIQAFYEQADIAALYKKYELAMEQESDRYRKFLSKLILETNAYLRLDTSGYFDRKFAIYISPLGAPNQTNARSYGDNYYIVVSPSAEIPESEILHGWLHYLLDAYPYRNASAIEQKSALQKIADRIGSLDPSLKSNFSLLLTESLIRAIQARRAGGTPQQKQHMVNEAMQSGYILTAYFFEAMAEFEKQPVGMKLYYSDMIDAIDVKKEQSRLAKVSFSTQAPDTHETLWSSVEQVIRHGEDYIARGQFDEARKVFESLSQENGPQPRALYDLAIIASLEKQPQVAKQYFTQAAGASADPHIKAWSHIYLGRIADLQGDRDGAKAEYSAALNAGDPAPDTRAAAEKGLQESFAPPEKAASGKGPPPSIPPPDEKPRKGSPLGKD